MALDVTDSRLKPISGGASLRLDATGGVESLDPPQGAVYALVVAVDAVEWRDDGVVLTTGNGMPLAAGQSIWTSIEDLSDFQVLGGEVAVSYYNQA